MSPVEIALPAFYVATLRLAQADALLAVVEIALEGPDTKPMPEVLALAVGGIRELVTQGRESMRRKGTP